MENTNSHYHRVPLNGLMKEGWLDLILPSIFLSDTLMWVCGQKVALDLVHFIFDLLK